MNDQTYYEILGLPKYGRSETGEKISIDIITNAKNTLKFGDESFRVPFSMWDKIDEAYNVLSNETKREEYDKSLKVRPVTNDEEINNNNVQEKSISNLKNINNLQITKKSVLSRTQQEQLIIEFKTNESKLIEQYRKKLEERIDQLLNESHSNYHLKIEKIKYENYIELLKRIIELRQNTLMRGNKILQIKFEIISLKKQLEQFESKLKEINEKINQSEKLNNVFMIQEELIEINKKIRV